MRGPRLVDVAGAIAGVACLAVGLAWWDHRDRDPAPRPPVTTVVGFRQPLISFPVYAGCGSTPDDVLLDGVSIQQPASLFDHGQHRLAVRVGATTAEVSVAVADDGRLLVGAGGAMFGVGVYLRVGALELCAPAGG